MKLLSLIKKEFRRFFHDPKLIITMIVPGIIIYAIYSIMGTILHEEERYDYRAYVSGESVVVAMIESSLEGDWKFLPAEDVEAAKQEVESGKADALIVFPENFDEAVAAYTPASGEPAPAVQVYCNTKNDSSTAFLSITTSVLEGYEQALANKFNVNVSDFTTPTEMASTIMSALLPFLIVIFIFSACMSVTLESVAGEKERGTLATILITSARRSDVVLGKVLPLSCISAIGAASSFLGVVLSLPRLMGMSLSVFSGALGFLGYFLFFLLIVGIVPLIVSLISVISAYAKTVKEASAYTSVVMILTMVISLISTFLSGIGNWVVAVPVLNAVVCIQRLLEGGGMVWQSLVSFGLNFVYTALLVLLITKMLSSERIMFGR